VHHRTIQINHQPAATVFQFIVLTFVYSSTSFGRFPAHYQELNDCSDSLWFYLRIVVTVVLCFWSLRQRTQHDCHHDTKVKPEAVTAVFELLMMGDKTPETCWAVNKCQNNKLENFCVWLVIYLNPTIIFTDYSNAVTWNIIYTESWYNKILLSLLMFPAFPLDTTIAPGTSLS
jgi:hypothetical protein